MTSFENFVRPDFCSSWTCKSNNKK